MEFLVVVALRVAGVETWLDAMMPNGDAQGAVGGPSGEPGIDPLATERLNCKARLVHHLAVQEQYFRKQAWAIVQNTVSGQFLRIDAGLWEVLEQLQGTLSLRDWLAEHEPRYSQITLLEAVTHLHRHGLISGLPEEDSSARQASQGAAFNPLMLKLPLFNPSPLLECLVRWTVRVSGKLVLFVILSLFVTSLLIAGLNSERLVSDWNRVLEGSQNWWQYLVLYPCLKCLHELGHAMTLKRLGGEVKQAGISFLVLMPIPYVDATDAWSLERRGDRLLVSAAGMLSDITVASVAVLAWFALQPGVLTDMAFAVVLLSFVSVVMFNANPLLKFDGYYLLEDALDSPGLARRSVSYWQYLFKRYLFSARDVLRPVVAQGERRWLLPYGVASLAYRIFISIVISVFLVRQLHEVGMVLAAFSIIPLFVRPLPRLVRYLGQSVQLQEKRLQAVVRLLMLCAVVLAPIVLLPLPSSTRAEGIVWVAQQAEIYAREQGDIQQWHVRNGEAVSAGQLLLQLQAPELLLELERLDSEIALLALEHAALRSTAVHLASNKKVEMDKQQEAADRLRDRVAALDVVAPHAGRVAFADDKLLTGQRVKQGQLLIYLVEENSLVVRAVVDQRQLGKVEKGVSSANVRLADDILSPLPATLVRQTPAGNNSLPSMALANAGFGGIDVQSRDGDMQTLEEIFHLELILDDTVTEQGRSTLGGRAFITLRHSPETLGQRWWRSARQLFLRHLGA